MGKTLSSFAISLVFTAYWITGAQANIGEDFGYGPRSASLGGASAAWNFDGYAAYNNPAGLPLINRSGTGFTDERFSLSYGIIYMNPQFTPITGVVTINSYSSGPGVTPQTGTVDNSYKNTFGQMFGASWRADPEWMNLTLGLTVFFPFAQLALIDSGETLEPEYVLYRDRTQQPDVTFAGGIEILPGLHFGAGMHVDYTLATTSDATLLQTTAGPSTARLQTSIAPKVTPFFGLQMNDSDKTSIGFVARFPSSVTSTIRVNSYFQPLGSLNTVPVTFAANDTIVYQPLSFELSGMIKTSENTRTFGQLDYQSWSHFQAPFLMISNPCAGAGCGIPTAGGPTLDAQYRDIWIPRIGEEISIGGKTTVRLGYAYHQSIFKTTPAGIGNYLDPSKHLINAGMGWVFDRFLGYHKPWNLDVSLNYEQLITQTVTKSPGDEAGNLSSQKIGAPGYEAGGHVLGGQVALTLGI